MPAKGYKINDDLRSEIFEYIQFMVTSEIEEKQRQFDEDIDIMKSQIEDMVSLFKKFKPQIRFDGELKRERVKRLVYGFSKKYNLETRKIYSYIYREMDSQGLNVYVVSSGRSILDGVVESGMIHALYKSLPSLLRNLRENLLKNIYRRSK